MSLSDSAFIGGWQKITFPVGPKAIARRIIAETAAKYGEKVHDVVGDRRFVSLVLCRREAAWRIANETKLSFVQIGAMLGKDHSTIIRAIKRQNEATGTNVRNQGVLSEERIRMNREAADRSRARHNTPLTPAQKRRRNRMRAEALYHRRRKAQ